MSYDPPSSIVVCHAKMHATLKRNYQLMPALKWPRLLLNNIPDKYEHLVRYCGYYANRSRGARKQLEHKQGAALPIRIDQSPIDAWCKANWARLIQKIYQVGPLVCPNCGTIIRIIALIDDDVVVERILRHLKLWDPISDPVTPLGPDPPWPKHETLSLTYHPVPDIA